MKSLMLRFTSGVTSPCVTEQQTSSFIWKIKKFPIIKCVLKTRKAKKIEHPSEKHGTKRKL